MAEGATTGSIRRMTSADLAMVLAWRNAPEVRRYMYTQHEISWEEHCVWFAQSSRDPRKHLLVYQEGSEALGFVSFSESATGGIADWGFYLAPEAARGTGGRLGQAALRHGFEVLSLHKICGQVLEYNERSIAFHRRLGFRQEGVLRDQYYDGQQYHAVICFGLLVDEWLTIDEE